MTTTTGRIANAVRISKNLETIPLGGTRIVHGVVVTRWQRGYELGTINGENLMPLSDASNWIAKQYLDQQ